MSKHFRKVIAIFLCMIFFLSAGMPALEVRAEEYVTLAEDEVAEGLAEDAATEEVTAAEELADAQTKEPEQNAEEDEDAKQDAEVSADAGEEGEAITQESSLTENPDETLLETEEEEIVSATSKEIAGLIESAEEAFLQILPEKDVMALIYLTDAYEVKAQPSATASTICILGSAHTVFPTAVTIEENGRIWYQVNFFANGTEQSGYVEDDYLAYSDENWIAWKEQHYAPIAEALGEYFYSMDADEDPYADVMKFPVGYRAALRALKAAHPNWIFVPMDTGLDFMSSVKNEMGDKSWIQATQFNKDHGFVGESVATGWYYATQAGVAYYMNPVNFLDEQSIFQFELLTYNVSYHTTEAVQAFLNGTFMKGALPDDSDGKTYAQAFFEIGKNRKLSPVHLASRVYQEQGKGTSPLISGTYPGYEGYYNFFNVKASGKTNEEVIKNGLAHAKASGWNTRYKSLAGGADTIGNGYILKGQDTVYLEKFNVNKNAANALYTHQYMQNVQAPSTEGKTTYKMYNGAGSINSPFVFKIPVFTNMPGDSGDTNPIAFLEMSEEKLVLRRPDTVKQGVKPTVADQNVSKWQLQTKMIAEDTAKETTDDTHILWKSSDTKVATVDENGEVNAVGSGKAVITATLDRSTAVTKPTASCEVTVIAPIVKVGITDHQTEDVKEITIYIGEEVRLAPDYLPRDTTDEWEAVWAVANESIATVSEDGRVRGKKIGSTVVKLTLLDYQASVTVKVAGSTVLFMNEKGTSTIKTLSNLAKGVCLDVSDFPDMTAIATAEKKRFVGWYTEPEGKGQKVDETTPLYAETTSLYPCLIPEEQPFYVVPVGDRYYTGSPIKPNVIVYDSETIAEGGKREPLVLNVDYTLAYSNNKVANDIGKPQPTITIKGKGNYTGSQPIYFNILKVNLNSIDVDAQDLTVKYTGKRILSDPVLMRDGKRLKKNTDYTLTYPETWDGAYKIPGTYPIKVEGKGGYTGTVTVYETISLNPPAAATNISKNAMVIGLEDKFYTGDYRDVLQNNLKVALGTAELVESKDGKTGDYTVTYKNTERVGTASVEINGIGKYTGKITKKYKITHALLEQLQLEKKLNIQYEAVVPYTKGKTKPAVKLQVTEGKGDTLRTFFLKEGSDYTIAYKNNAAVTTSDLTAEQKPYLTITGKGNYKGQIRCSFVITDGQFADSNKVHLEAKDVVFKNRAEAYKKTTLTVTDNNGSKLQAGKDYEKTYAYYYADSDKAPSVKNEAGDILVRKAGEEVQEGDIPQPGTEISMKVTSKGFYTKGDSPSVRYAVYRIISEDINKAKVEILNKKYYLSGAPVTLSEKDIRVTINKEPLRYGVDYYIDESSYSKNINYGTATVWICGLTSKNDNGDTLYYGGRKQVKFSIQRKFFIW